MTQPLAGLKVLEVAQFAADRKSTRLNSSHSQISYAVFCLIKQEEVGGDRLRDVFDVHDAGTAAGEPLVRRLDLQPSVVPVYLAEAPRQQTRQPRRAVCQTH